MLAFQIAGEGGLRALHPEGLDAERETPPAEPLLAELVVSARSARGPRNARAYRRSADVRPREGRHGPELADPADQTSSNTCARQPPAWTGAPWSPPCWPPIQPRPTPSGRTISTGHVFDVFNRQREEGMSSRWASRTWPKCFVGGFFETAGPSPIQDAFRSPCHRNGGQHRGNQ